MSSITGYESTVVLPTIGNGKSCPDPESEATLSGSSAPTIPIFTNLSGRERSLSISEQQRARNYFSYDSTSVDRPSFQTPKRRTTVDAELRAYSSSLRTHRRRSLKEISNYILATNAAINAKGSNTKSITVDGAELQKKPWYLLSCNAKQRTFWDVILLILVGFIAIVSPLRLGFDIESANPFEWIIIDNGVDFMFIFDIILNFFTTYIDDNEIEIFDHKAICKHYLHHWFTIDTLSSIPFSWIMGAGNAGVQATKTTKMAKVGQAGKFVKVMRALKMLKLIRIVKASQFLSRFADFFTCGRMQRKIWKIALLTILIAHFNACLFGFAAQINDAPMEHTWYMSAGLIDSNVMEQYVAALYFCVGTITTVGYGDITPASTEERLIVIYLMVVGSGYYSYVIATISKCLDLLEISKLEYHRKLDELSQYMKYQKFPRGLYGKVQSALKLNFRHSNLRGKEHILSGLSPALKQEVQMFMCNTKCGRLLRSISFFKAFDSQHIFKLVHVLRACSMHAGDYIVRRGQTGVAMYIVDSGTLGVETYTETEEEKAESDVLGIASLYKEGSYFGEEVLLGLQSDYRRSIIALDFSELLSLNRFDFKSIVGNDTSLLDSLIGNTRLWGENAK